MNPEAFDRSNESLDRMEKTAHVCTRMLEAMNKKETRSYTKASKSITEIEKRRSLWVYLKQITSRFFRYVVTLGGLKRK